MSCLLEALMTIADERKGAECTKVRHLMALTCTLFSFSMIRKVSSTQLKKYKLSLRADGTLRYDGVLVSAFKQSVYLASFTANEDDILQWRLYSANGTGVSLKLKVPIGKTKIKLSDNESKWVHCVQVKYTKRENAVDIFKDIVNSMLAKDEQLPEIAKYCWDQAVSIKHEDYEHEAECRVVVYHKNGALKQKYLATSDTLRPYIELPIINDHGAGGMMLDEIMTGPRSRFDGSKDEDWKQFVESKMGKIRTTHSSKQIR
jgi:hypothetical protein